MRSIPQNIITYHIISNRGVIGSGKQGFSWVSLSDVVRAIDFLLTDAKAGKLRGPVNVCSPNPSDNAGFTTAMGRLGTDLTDCITDYYECYTNSCTVYINFI